MKKIMNFYVLIILVISAVSVFADNSQNTCTYEPDIKDEKYLIRTCWFHDDAGHKIIDQSAGYAGKTDIYEHILDVDGRYEHIQEKFLDPNGNLMNGPDEYAKMTTDYTLHEGGPSCRMQPDLDDPTNNLCGFTRSFFDANENPALVKNVDTIFYYIEDLVKGQAQIVGFEGSFIDGSYASLSVLMEKTDSQYIEKTSFYGTDGKPLLYGGVYAVYESRVGLSDGTWERMYRGINGELVDTPFGYARKVQTYTEDNKESFIRCYHANNQPATDIETGVHAIHYFYGPSYRQIPRTDYLDIHDNLTNNNKGYSTIINEYMDSASPSETIPMNLSSRYPIKTIYLDKDGNEVVPKK